MTHILVIWTVVAMAGTKHSIYEKNGWMVIGDFRSAEACQAAAAQLGITQKENFRCLQK